jgi:hypothetical protein
MARSCEPPSMALRRYLPGHPGDVGAGRHIPHGPGDQELLAAWRDDRPEGWLPRWESARKCPAGRNHPVRGDSPSPAFLAGASLAITAGAMVADWVTGQLGRAAGPSGQGTVQTVIDWLVVTLFLFLMMRTFLRRKDTKRPKWMGGCSMACPASSTLRARSVAETAAPRAMERLRRVVRLARLTHQQRACGAGCRTPASRHPGTWPYFGTVSAATLMLNGAWTTGGGHAGSCKRADRSVMGILVSTLGLLPAATGKAAAPPDGKRWRRNLPLTAT